MEDFNPNNYTWEDDHISFNSSRNATGSYGYFYYAALCIICLGLVVTLSAITAVFTLLKRDQAAPVYIINLLISDLIQLCCSMKIIIDVDLFTGWIYFASLFASVGFMVCVSMERYLIIAKPLWYRFKRNIKTSLLICAVVWTIAILWIVALCVLHGFFQFILLFFSFLLPLPFFIFFLVGTIRGLSAAISVPADEKRRIVAILVLVFIVYILLILPAILFIINPTTEILMNTAVSCILAFPLADASLYLLLKKSAIDKLLASLCCCKMLNDQLMSSTCDDTVSAPCTETV